MHLCIIFGPQVKTESQLLFIYQVYDIDILSGALIPLLSVNSCLTFVQPLQHCCCPHATQQQVF